MQPDTKQLNGVWPAGATTQHAAGSPKCRFSRHGASACNGAAKRRTQRPRPSQPSRNHPAADRRCRLPADRRPQEEEECGGEGAVWRHQSGGAWPAAGGLRRLAVDSPAQDSADQVADHYSHQP